MLHPQAEEEPCYSNNSGVERAVVTIKQHKQVWPTNNLQERQPVLHHAKLQLIVDALQVEFPFQ